MSKVINLLGAISLLGLAIAAGSMDVTQSNKGEEVSIPQCDPMTMICDVDR